MVNVVVLIIYLSYISVYVPPAAVDCLYSRGDVLASYCNACLYNLGGVLAIVMLVCIIGVLLSILQCMFVYPGCCSRCCYLVCNNWDAVLAIVMLVCITGCCSCYCVMIVSITITWVML